MDENLSADALVLSGSAANVLALSAEIMAYAAASEAHAEGGDYGAVWRSRRSC